MGDQKGQIGSGLHGGKALGVLPKSLPIPREGWISAEPGHILAPLAGILRLDGGGADTVLAQQFSGYPLHELGKQLRLHQSYNVRMAVGINESWSHNCPGSRNLPVGLPLADLAHMHDAVPLDANISFPFWLACTINHSPP